jgi:predicted HTH domain antitoxin
MQQLVLTYPDDLKDAVHLSPDEMSALILLMAAMKLYELGKLSSGRAALLAGRSRVEFLEECSRYGISPYNYSDDEVEEQLRHDVEAAAKASIL